MMQYLLRVDSMALAWKARTSDPAESVDAWTLAADLFSGRAGPEDDITVRQPDPDTHDEETTGLLRDLLDAQYTW
ncbi:MAG TPA: hypothetical protein VGG75_40600, partial [Trebonia sp.]